MDAPALYYSGQRKIPMTKLLQQAISEVQKRAEAEQDAIAAVILEELADEAHWGANFEQSQSQLSRMSAKVPEDICAGRIVCEQVSES
jgi:hypothetical protein